MTKFHKLQKYLLSRRGVFTFKQVGMGTRYSSVYYTYFNLIHNAGIVKRLERGLYCVQDRERLARVSLSDLVNIQKLKTLKYKYDRLNEDYCKLVRERTQFNRNAMKACVGNIMPSERQ